MTSWRRLAIVVALIPTLGAGASSGVRIDDWDARDSGPLQLGTTWRSYPFYERSVFKQAPVIVTDEGRRALRLTTENEAMRVGRAIKVDMRRTPWLVWEWKPLLLPAGDVRDRRRNDQAARVMVIFEGMKGIAYLWDTSAPLGTEVEPDELEIFQRALVVVRAGSFGIGQWDRQRRNVDKDYRRIFGEEPRLVTWVGFESHSNDTATRSAALFGTVSFEPSSPDN